MSLLHQFLEDFRHNLFKPLLLFSYMGFLVPILGVKLDFPHVLYQGLTIFLLVAIGWHGGEELAKLSLADLGKAGGFMAVGFVAPVVFATIGIFVARAYSMIIHQPLELGTYVLFSVLCG